MKREKCNFIMNNPTISAIVGAIIGGVIVGLFGLWYLAYQNKQELAIKAYSDFINAYAKAVKECEDMKKRGDSVSYENLPLELRYSQFDAKIRLVVWGSREVNEVLANWYSVPLSDIEKGRQENIRLFNLMRKEVRGDTLPNSLVEKILFK